MFIYSFKTPSADKVHFPNDFFRVSTVINQVWIKQISGGGKKSNKTELLIMFSKRLSDYLLYKKMSYERDNDH